MIVVADTGPVIALGTVGRIALLEIFEAPIVILLTFGVSYWASRHRSASGRLIIRGFCH